ncbi:hypothetical protein MRX96_019868 [Rhipicephalus microplus]
MKTPYLRQENLGVALRELLADPTLGAKSRLWAKDRLRLSESSSVSNTNITDCRSKLDCRSSRSPRTRQLVCSGTENPGSKVASVGASPDDDAQYTLGSAILACIMCLLFSLLVVYFLFYLFVTDLRGLLCHSDADGFLGAAIPNGCDFIMVDVPLLPPQRHPLYSYMTTIKFTSATLERRIVQHVNTAQDTPLLLVVERSVLRSTAFSPQAVIRGVLQKVVDMKGHGVVLSDHEITDADTADIVADSQTLSDEVQSHHGIIRYDVFSGNRSALRNLMLDVARKPSVTFVYRMSGISRTFTHLYFDNFYSIRMKEENLLCAMPQAYLQCHHHSAMTRHYADNNNVEADVFFEVEATFSSKVYLIMAQMKTAGLLPAAFIVERYDLDTPSEIRFYDADTGRDVECAATPFGFTKTTKEKLDVLVAVAIEHVHGFAALWNVKQDLLPHVVGQFLKAAVVDFAGDHHLVPPDVVAHATIVDSSEDITLVLAHEVHVAYSRRVLHSALVLLHDVLLPDVGGDWVQLGELVLGLADAEPFLRVVGRMN